MSRLSLLLLGILLAPSAGFAAKPSPVTSATKSTQELQPEPTPEQVAPLLVVEGRVLLEGQAELTWAAGQRFTATRVLKPGMKARRAYRSMVHPARLPPDLQARLKSLAEKPLNFFNAQGKLCSGRVGTPELHVEVDDTKKALANSLAPSEIPQQHHLWLVANLETEHKHCEDASWAWPQDQRTPTIWQKQEHSPAAQLRIARARKAFLKSEEHAELRQLFFAQRKEAPANAEKDWQATLNAGLHFEYWSAPTGSDSMLFMHFKSPALSEEVGRVIEFNREGQQSVDTLMQPIAVFDADGDGIVEILEEDDFGRWLFEGSPDLLSGWSFLQPEEPDGC